MTSDETVAVLKVRRDLTGESFNDGTVIAWTEALGAWPMPTVRSAVVAAAREHKRVAVADVVERLPQRARPPGPPVDCELCDGTGWVDDPGYHSKRCTRALGCPCHGVKPCRCTRGQQMIETQRRILEANRR